MITVSTYNILHGYHKEQIIKNIALFIEKGSDIICLQEVDRPFEEYLNAFIKTTMPKWSVEYTHLGWGCDLAIMWNSAEITLHSSATIRLPIAPESPYDRGALSAEFSRKGSNIRVTSAHLSWEGGLSRRFEQLRCLRDTFQAKPCDHEILCGDFNTSAPSLFRKYQKRKVQDALGTDWKNVLPDLVWTCDVSDSYPADTFHKVSTTLKLLGFKLRMCLDYMLVRNLKIVSGEMLDIPGSDHRPLICRLDME